MKRVRLVHRVEYAVARSGLFLVGLLPERLAYACLAGLARVFLWCSPKRRRVGRANVLQALPHASEREVRRLVRRGTANAFQNVLDLVFGMRWLARGRLAERIDTSALAVLPPRGTPFIGVTLHLGSWEMSAVAVALATGGAEAIGRPPRNPLTAAFLKRRREAAGLVMHPRRGGIRPLVRALARGCPVLQVVDQNQRLRGVFVPFFGRLASTERSAATLAVRKGYPVFAGACVRSGGGFRFRFEVVPPFRASPTGDAESDVRAACRQINALVETLVLRHPDQYLWIHDRYRTRPPGSDDRAAASGRAHATPGAHPS